MDIDIVCELPDAIDREFLNANLPLTKTKLWEAKYINELLHLKLFTTSNTVDEAKQWIKDFEKVSQTSYSVTNTRITNGRYLDFKRNLHCRHKTRSKHLYDSSKEINKTRNTNCPSTIKVTLHAKKKRYQSKDMARNELFKEMRCEIDLILPHNHNIGPGSGFRKVWGKKLKVTKHKEHMYCRDYVQIPARNKFLPLLEDDPNLTTHDSSMETICTDFDYDNNSNFNDTQDKYIKEENNAELIENAKETAQIPAVNRFLPLLEDDPNLTTHGSLMETINTGFNYDNNTNYNDIQEKDIKEENNAELIENAKETAQVIINEFCNMCVYHIEKSPNAVGAALEQMLENMRRIRAVSAFTSACSSFASDHLPRKAVRRTVTSRRRNKTKSNCI